MMYTRVSVSELVQIVNHQRGAGSRYLNSDNSYKSLDTEAPRYPNKGGGLGIWTNNSDTKTPVYYKCDCFTFYFQFTGWRSAKWSKSKLSSFDVIGQIPACLGRWGLLPPEIWWSCQPQCMQDKSWVIRLSRNDVIVVVASGFVLK
jgi:hypothetical protein